jgi:hypothetical protein
MPLIGTGNTCIVPLATVEKMAGPSSSIETLRSACEESRAVLDHEIAILDDIDDKAIWTVRTAVILIGLVVSAASVAGSNGVLVPTSVNVAAGAGVTVLFVTIVSGIFTYSISAPEPGISAQYRTAVLAQDIPEAEWRAELLEGYNRWIAQMQLVNEKNGWYLFLTQALLLFGVFLLALAGGLTIWSL